MFTVTPTAAEQILRAAEAMDEGGSQPAMLRVAAKIEDGGIVYGMGFDEERENDHVILSEGVTLLIAPRSGDLLAGASLDFVELNPGEFQFVFVNPNEVGDVGGCGGSFQTGGGGGCGGCGRSCG